jgi:exopolyphosphatase/guanosine-5'-triphosphate,3'-diphosphate pyrophosphatase
MAIYERTSRYAFHLLHEEKSKVRISQDAYKHQGYLQSKPMQRTFDALCEFQSIIKSLKVKKTLCVATSALRDAPNKKDFVKKVRDHLKLNIKIIDGEKEAYYGGIACLNLLPNLSAALSIDIGGGSTEFTYIDKNNLSNVISLNIGTVRLKELFFDTNKREEAIEYIDKELASLDPLKIDTLVGIGGTFRAISNSIMKRSNYPLNKLHAYQYTPAILQDYLQNILKADQTQLKSLGIKNNRYDVIQPGALILERVLHKIQFSKIITSGVGVREGVYLSDLLRNSKEKFPHNFNTSVKYLLDSNVADTTFSNQLSLLSKKLFDLTYKYFNLDIQYRYDLALAAKLYPIGSNLHFYSQNKHTYYFIKNALEYGFTHKNIILIASLTKYAKGKPPSELHLNKYKELLPDTHTTNTLSYLLSLSISLLSHRPRNIDFDLKFKNGILKVDSRSKLYLSRNAVAKLTYNEQDFEVLF